MATPVGEEDNYGDNSHKDTIDISINDANGENFENISSRRDQDERIYMLLYIARRIQSVRCCGRSVIDGIESVIHGNIPASESVRICGIRPPRYFFYMVSGTLCDFVQFFIDYFLYKSIGLEDPSMCWALGFGLSIVVRHSSHRYL
eukprot:6336420-Ditylum_brightwellii.AAC.1